MNREELIEEAANAMSQGFVQAGHVSSFFALAETALAVFEKAQAPTDDEREALGELLRRVSERENPSWHEDADAILAAGFRRSAQIEPTDAHGLAAMTDPNSITDEQADAAQLAHYRFVFGDEGLPNQRALGVGRQAMKVAISEALKAAFSEGRPAQIEPTDAQVIAALNAWHQDVMPVNRLGVFGIQKEDLMRAAFTAGQEEQS